MTTPAAGTPAPAAAAPTPAPAPAAPAPAPAPASLLDAAAPAPSPAPAAPTPAPAPGAPAPAPAPAAHPEWFYANGVKGEGAPPEWYKATKYKTVEEQARAYPELEKRFGTFTGAPKDGKYEFKMPDGLEGEFDQEDPNFIAFNKWAVDNQLSQEGYQAILGMYATNLAALTPDFEQIKASLGEKADERITAAATWAKANLDEAGMAKFKAATAGANAAEVFEVIEAVINKTRQPALPKPGENDPTSGAPSVEAAIKLEMAKVGGDGKPLYFDRGPAGQAHRAKVEKMRNEFYAAQGSA